MYSTEKGKQGKRDRAVSFFRSVSRERIWRNCLCGISCTWYYNRAVAADRSGNRTAVYPGNNFKEHLRPFTEGAFSLDGRTKKAGAVMPYYTVSYGIDQKYGENVGNSYNKYLIQDLLRDELGYDGVVCTDWGITHDIGAAEETFAGKCWGVESLTEAERHFKALEAGVDQFGGNNNVASVMEAYRMCCDKYGTAAADARFRRSAYRLLLNIFRTGLFENPYLDLEESLQTVGCSAFREKGYS